LRHFPPLSTPTTRLHRARPGARLVRGSQRGDGMRSRSGWVRARPLVRGAGVLALLAALSQTGARAESAAPIAGTCPHQHFAAARKAVLHGALHEGRDVLGERLTASPRGPTYAAVRALLPPLWYALGRGGRPLTTTGSYYLTFAHPLSLYGAKAFALHVADGSEIITRRTGG